MKYFLLSVARIGTKEDTELVLAAVYSTFVDSTVAYSINTEPLLRQVFLDEFLRAERFVCLLRSQSVAGTSRIATLVSLSLSLTVLHVCNISRSTAVLVFLSKVADK